jgi:D-3-phosphoglycerate dehydrogenase
MKVLISSRSFGKIDSGALQLLKDRGLKPILNPYGRKLTQKEMEPLLDGTVGIIAGTETISKSILEQAVHLRVISRYGVGLDNIDMKIALEKGILVYNTPESPSISVSELTVTLMLTLLRKIGIVDQRLKNNQWKPEMGTLLKGKTVGILGLGRIGKQVVQLLTAFQVKCIAHEPNPDTKFVTTNHITLVSLNTLLSESDIVTLHLPLNEKTNHLIGKHELNLMKKNAVIINTARGGLIDEQALYHALKNHAITGAAIDVFENEPNIGKLQELDTVILTPHIGTYTFETRKHMELEAAKNLIKGLEEVQIL